MTSPNLRDLLVSFSPSSDLFATASADGRIKVWDAVRGLPQTDFSNLAPSSATAADGILAAPDAGHLSLDYTCIKWLQLGAKKKRKAASSLLVLGTGHGDVVAVDVAAGQLKWKFSDCHPGGVTAVSFSKLNSSIYTAGVDRMVCQINPSTGSLLSRFEASATAISALAISADGKILAAASAQIKIFSCTNNKKIQRFPGHPVAVRCMIFSEDGKYILSSAVGEKYIAIWRIDDGKKQPACCVLSMEHPAVLLDSKCSDAEGTEGSGLYVLAVSETGLCYFWFGQNIDELRVSKPTKILLSNESPLSKFNKSLSIFAAKIQEIVRPATGLVLIAHGSLIKPSFEKLTVQYGVDMNLEASQEGALLPRGQSNVSQKGQTIQSKVTALDRANAEDAILPLPKLYSHDKKRKHSTPHLTADVENEMDGLFVSSNDKTSSAQKEDNVQHVEEEVMCVEDKLREVGILGNKEMTISESYARTLTDGADLSFDANTPAKKIRSHILSMSPGDAYKLLESLVSTWKTRSANPKHVLTWIYYILVSHGHFIISQDSSSRTLDALQKMTGMRCTTVKPLLKLSGRLGLIMTQIDKAGQNVIQVPSDDHHDDASEDEDIDELVYGEEEDESQSGTDDDMEHEE